MQWLEANFFVFGKVYLQAAKCFLEKFSTHGVWRVGNSQPVFVGFEKRVLVLPLPSKVRWY